MQTEPRATKNDVLGPLPVLELAAALQGYRLTVRTSKGRLHVTPDPPECLCALLEQHGRMLYRFLSQWGDGFGLALLCAVRDLPPAPFMLHPGITVTDAECFRAALIRDALDGPDGPRGAALERDVIALLWQLADTPDAAAA